MEYRSAITEAITCRAFRYRDDTDDEESSLFLSRHTDLRRRGKRTGCKRIVLIATRKRKTRRKRHGGAVIVDDDRGERYFQSACFTYFSYTTRWWLALIKKYQLR